MKEWLQVLSGLCWTLTYGSCIWIGLRDKTYAMPFVALALNLSWEGLYTVRDFWLGDFSIQLWVNLVWFLADLVMAYTYFTYGKKDFPAKKAYFLPWSVFILVMSLALQVAFMQGFGEMVDPLGNMIPTGAVYAAFLQNLLMSFLFLDVYFKRRDKRGQHWLIAVSKCLGTLAPTILFGYYGGNSLVLLMGIFTFLVDTLYIACLLKSEEI